MSKKGNINYKYLRRRKSWIRRNMTSVIIAAVALVVIIVAVIAGVFIGKNINNNNDNKNQTNVVDNKASEASEETTDEVNWIEETVPESVKDVQTQEEIETKMAETESIAKSIGSTKPYFIKVNRAANCVTVYGIDNNGEYTRPVIAFASSCGRAGQETPLVENYVTSDKYPWRLMVDGTYAQYATRIAGTDGILFHSIPYNSQSANNLEEGQYNKIGDYASLGCVRLCVRDCKWIYDNCPAGTGVTIYDDASNPGPLGKPESIKIPENSEYAGWDPTDPREENPWNSFSAKISGAADIKVKVGESVNLLNGVTAVDTCGNDITNKIYVLGKYTVDEKGTYEITYKVVDALGRSDEVKVNLVVE